MGVRWCVRTVWSHLKGPVGDAGGRAGDGTSHPGPGTCAVSPTDASLVDYTPPPQKGKAHTEHISLVNVLTRFCHFRARTQLAVM